MNGLGNQILVVDMRGRADTVTAEAAIALAADPTTRFDQIMAITTRARPEPKISSASLIRMGPWRRPAAMACAAWCRHWSETGRRAFTFETIAGILTAEEHADGTISVDMGVPRFGWDEIPLAEEFAVHPHDRIAGRADRCARCCIRLGRLMGQSPRDLLGRWRRLGPTI